MTVEAVRLVDQFELGLDAPICLTWELTYACNLSCVHCLSSSGKRDPRELSTEQCKAIIDELHKMQVFYVNIGGGEPTVRSDFWELVDYATEHHVGVKFSTNGVRITPEVAAKLAASDYVDVQISLDGATAEVNDEVRGPGSFAMAIAALENLAAAGFRDAKISVVMTRQNVAQLDDFKALADNYGATLRITRLRPSGSQGPLVASLDAFARYQREDAWTFEHMALTRARVVAGTAAGVAAVLTALGIGWIGRRSGLKQDSAIGIVFVGMFALGVVMLSRASTFTTDLSNFLIGNPLGVTPADLWGALAVTLGVGLVTRNTLAAIIGGGVTLGLGHWLIG